MEPSRLKLISEVLELRGGVIFNKNTNRFVGGKGNYGYTVVNLKGKLYLYHRVVWLETTGEWPKGQIDHIDTDKSNNLFGNLRLATPSQNQANTPRQRNNTSGYKGVHFSKRLNKYVASIKVNRKRTHLGCFCDPELASLAYDTAAEKFFGASARTNTTP